MLKMRFVVILSVLLIFLSVAVASQPISVTVNGRSLTMDTQPVIRDGRTLVPLRAIFEALGAAVEWDAATNTITGKSSDKTIILQINNRTARVNNNTMALDVPPAIISGRTMVPTRFIAESLGARVNWDGHARRVSVETGEIVAPVLRSIPAQVIRITDGDTIRVRLESGIEENVRLIGVNAPESTREVEPFGKEAAAFTQNRLGGKTVFLETDVSERDRFGRFLAYVWLTQPGSGNAAEVRAKMFSAELLLAGYAQVMTISPNVKYANMFVEFEREARNAGRGLWATAAAPVGGTVSGIVIASVDLVGEIVILENRSLNSIDISGWVLVSEVGNQRFTFPSGTVIAANSSITVVSGPNATAGTGRLVWTRSHIWNNDGDPAVLLNLASVEVARK